MSCDMFILTNFVAFIDDWYDVSSDDTYVSAGSKCIYIET